MHKRLASRFEYRHRTVTVTTTATNDQSIAEQTLGRLVAAMCDLQVSAAATQRYILFYIPVNAIPFSIPHHGLHTKQT